MSKSRLFRKEVLTQLQHKHLGPVFLNKPLPYLKMVLSWCFLVMILIGVMFHQEYTEKWVLKGFINAKEGVTHLYAPAGIVKTLLVEVGQHVQKGQVLFVLNTQDVHGDEAQLKALEHSYQLRRAGLQQALEGKQAFLERLKPLLEKQYIAKSFFEEKREEILRLKNEIHQLSSEELRFKQSKIAQIKAPISGVVSSVMVHVGQHVSQGKPLVSLLPKNTTYVAQLYIPVEKAGFLKVNDEVVLHYDAYPYQRFGVSKAKILSVSNTVLTDSDEDKPIKIERPYYQAIARLYASEQYVQQGMTFSAIASGMRRKVWQWLFLPLYTILKT